MIPKFNYTETHNTYIENILADFKSNDEKIEFLREKLGFIETRSSIELTNEDILKSLKYSYSYHFLNN
jgi:5'(3')-deoxyribonucleotidase